MEHDSRRRRRRATKKTGELTGDTLTEFLRLLNQEDISNAILDLKVIDLSFLQKKGDMLADTKTWHN